jgi:glycine dehydrogenase
MTWQPTAYHPDDFANRRHIGPSPSEMEEMLRAVGASSLDALIDETVPPSIRQDTALSWSPLTEAGLLARMREVASRNRVITSLIGQGYYGTFTPPAIQRNIFENPAWYTAYTPYQPEIAQGRLEALRTSRPWSRPTACRANASLLDEATAAAEAMTMAERSAQSKARAFFVARTCTPDQGRDPHPRAPLGLRDRGSAESCDRQGLRAIFQYPRPRPRATCRTTCAPPSGGASPSWRPTSSR